MKLIPIGLISLITSPLNVNNGWIMVCLLRVAPLCGFTSLLNWLWETKTNNYVLFSDLIQTFFFLKTFWAGVRRWVKPGEYLTIGTIPKLHSLYVTESIRPPPPAHPLLVVCPRAIKLEITLAETEPEKIAYLFYCLHMSSCYHSCYSNVTIGINHQNVNNIFAAWEEK